MGDQVKPDWRVIRFIDTATCNADWLQKNSVKETGVFYVYDHNRHVYIADLSPSFELHAMVPYVIHEGDVSDTIKEQADEDMRLAMYEQDVIYIYSRDIGVRPWKQATDYVDLPEREEEQNDDAYYMACVEVFREQFNANHPWF